MSNLKPLGQQLKIRYAELERAVKERRQREQDKANAEDARIANEARRRHSEAARQSRPITYDSNGFVSFKAPAAPAAPRAQAPPAKG